MKKVQLRGSVELHNDNASKKEELEITWRDLFT